MNINIKTTTISLTPAISEYVEKRLRSIEAFLQDDTTAQCDIELARTTNHHKQGDVFKAEVHIVAKDINIYASVEKEDLYAAIDIVRHRNENFKLNENPLPFSALRKERFRIDF